MSRAELAKAERKEAAQELRTRYGLTEGATVYILIRSVSSSGMSRLMTTYVVKDGAPVNVTWLVARALGQRMVVSKYGEGCLRVNGAGMDMAFALVYDLSMTLHGNGYALKNEKL